MGTLSNGKTQKKLNKFRFYYASELFTHTFFKNQRKSKNSKKLARLKKQKEDKQKKQEQQKVYRNQIMVNNSIRKNIKNKEKEKEDKAVYLKKLEKIKAERKNQFAYEAKSKLVAFLLSFFLGGLGIDWFYLSIGTAGYICAGIAKIIFVVITPICGKAMMSSGDGMAVCGGCCLCIMPGLVWCLADWIRILTGAFPDGNGMELYQDM